MSPNEQQHKDEFSNVAGRWWQLVSDSNAWLLAAAVVIGAVTALANVAFHWAIDNAHHLFWNELGGSLGIEERGPNYNVFDSGLPSAWWLIPLIPIAGMTLLAILDRAFPGEMKGYGLPRMLEMVNFRGGYLRRRWITLKTISSAITLGSGMSAGIEGPIAQIGASIGSTCARAIRPSADRLRILIACGSASAIAATFSSPIAGVMFAEEIVLLGQFRAQSFYLIVLAAGSSTVVSQYLLADHRILTAPVFDFPLNHELLFYVLMGMLAGLLAVFFIRTFYAVRDRFERSTIPATLQPVAGAMVVGMALVAFPQISASGYDTMNEAFKGQMAGGLLLALVFMKIIMTSVTLGCGGSGGVFAPAMFIGAVFGGGFAALVNTVIPGAISEPGGFALIGMGAFLSAATHAPLTAIFLLFELTRDYNVVLPIMITGATATIVARRLMTDSIDTYELSRRGLEVHATSETQILKNHYVRGLVSKDFQQIKESMGLTEFVRYVTNSQHMHFPVVNDEGELCGMIGMENIRGVLLNRDAWPYVVIGELADTDVTTLTGSDTLYEAMRVITSRGLDQVPVVDEDNPRKVVGMLKSSELQSFYQKRLLARELHG